MQLQGHPPGTRPDPRGRLLPVVLMCCLAAFALVIAYLASPTVTWLWMHPHTYVEGCSIGYDVMSGPLDLVGDLGLDPGQASALANGSLMMRISLPDLDRTVDFDYRFNGTLAYVNITSFDRSISIDDPAVGRPHRLSMHLVLGSDDPAVRYADVWARGNWLNLTFSITEQGRVVIVLDPGYEGLEGLVFDGMGAHRPTICLAPWEPDPAGGWRAVHGYSIRAELIMAD